MVNTSLEWLYTRRKRVIEQMGEKMSTLGQAQSRVVRRLGVCVSFNVSPVSAHAMLCYVCTTVETFELTGPGTYGSYGR